MIFVNQNSAIDKESLRAFALAELKNQKTTISSEISKPVWDELHNAIGSLENDNKIQKYREAESQILSLVGFIDSFVMTALDSRERFELYVQIKAADLKHSDQNHNYFWALQIRHDQVVALVTVVKNLTKNIVKWSRQSVNEILADEEFLNLIETSVEEQVYLEAEKVYKERSNLMAK